MFTVRKSVGVRVFLRQELDSPSTATILKEVSGHMPHEEIVHGTIESIVLRVMRSTYGVGNIELKNLTHHVANLVAQALTQNELKLFQSIQVDGGLLSSGIEEEGMKKTFERLRLEIPFLEGIMSM